MSVQDTSDIIDSFEDFYAELQGERQAKTRTKEIQRNLKGFNRGLKRYAGKYPWNSTVTIEQVRDALDDEKVRQEDEEYHLDGTAGMTIFARFLEFQGYEDALTPVNPDSHNRKYQINRDLIGEDKTPIDEIIDEFPLRYPVDVEADVAEYALAHLTRKKGVESVPKSRIAEELNERLGYEVNNSQLESRFEKKDRISHDHPGGGVEREYFFNEYSR